MVAKANRSVASGSSAHYYRGNRRVSRTDGSAAAVVTRCIVVSLDLGGMATTPDMPVHLLRRLSEPGWDGLGQGSGDDRPGRWPSAHSVEIASKCSLRRYPPVEGRCRHRRRYFGPLLRRWSSLKAGRLTGAAFNGFTRVHHPFESLLDDISKLSVKGGPVKIRPRYIYLKLFDDCNARCNMCDCWTVKSPRRDVAHYQAVLDRLLTSEVSDVRFTGGEPLLYRALPALIRQVTDAGSRASVITNGWLLPTRIRELVDAGTREVVVSVDGGRAVHDGVRGTAGLFDRCVRAMSLVRGADLSLGVNTVLQAVNIDHLHALAHQLLSADLRPSWWHLIPVRDNPALCPSDSQIATFRGGLPGLRAKTAAVGIQLVADATMFDPFGSAPCSVPQKISYIDGESGAMYGCNMLAYVEKPTGNIIETSPTDIYDGELARELVDRCAQGENGGCARCDASSRSMNHLFMERAISSS